MIKNLSGALGVRSVLDVGCSHGYAVSWLWRHGIKASGLDVSSIAISKAKAARGEEASRLEEALGEVEARRPVILCHKRGWIYPFSSRS